METRQLLDKVDGIVYFISKKENKMKLSKAKKELSPTDTILGESIYAEGFQNVIAVGATGTGKTRSVLEPNILQQGCTMVISDKGGRLFRECGGAFSNFEVVTTFNPIRYLMNSDDVAEFALRVTSNKKYATVIALVIMMMKEMKMETDAEDIMRFITAADEEIIRSLYGRANKRTLDMYQSLVFGNNGNYGEMTTHEANRMDPSERAEIASLLIPYVGENQSSPELYPKVRKTVFVHIKRKELREEYFRAVEKTVARVSDKKEHVRFILDDMISTYIPSADGELLKNGMSVIFTAQSESQLYDIYGERKAENIIANCQNYIFTGAWDIVSASPSAKRLGKSSSELPEAGKFIIISNRKVKYSSAYDVKLHVNYTDKKPVLPKKKKSAKANKPTDKIIKKASNKKLKQSVNTDMFAEPDEETASEKKYEKPIRSETASRKAGKETTSMAEKKSEADTKYASSEACSTSETKVTLESASGFDDFF